MSPLTINATATPRSVSCCASSLRSTIFPLGFSVVLPSAHLSLLLAFAKLFQGYGRYERRLDFRNAVSIARPPFPAQKCERLSRANARHMAKVESM